MIYQISVPGGVDRQGDTSSTPHLTEKSEVGEPGSPSPRQHEAYVNPGGESFHKKTNGVGAGRFVASLRATTKIRDDACRESQDSSPRLT